MRKIFAVALVAPVLFFSAPALAATGFLAASQCHVPPDHGIYADDGSNTLIGCITKDAWDAAQNTLTQIGQLPTFGAGQSVVDKHGIVLTCPVWFYMFRCVDPTNSEVYNNRMETDIRSLVASFGNNKARTIKAYPVFTGWINSL